MEQQETNEAIPCGLVLYSDGGARGGNPGFAGWGMHGYIFVHGPSKKPLGVPDNFITAKGYLQKSLIANLNSPEVRANDGPIAVPEEVTPLKYIDAFGSFANPTSNNVAELYGAINALSYAIKQPDFNIRSIQVFTDSEYTCKGLASWVDGWKANGWLKNDGMPPANVEVWKQLDALRNELEARGVIVNVDWVKAHNGDLGNEAADKHATLGVMASFQEKVVVNFYESDPTGYWKYTVDKHPMIANRRLYFNTQAGFNTPGVYYMGEHGKDDDLIGKRMSDGAYSVVRLNQPDHVIEMVRNHQINLSGDLDTLIMIRLDKLYRPDTHRDLKQHGTLAVEQPSNMRLDLHCLDKEPLTRELRPPRLAMRAVEAISDLIGRLDSHLAQDGSVVSTDLTDIFYDKEIKEKKGEQIVTYKLKPEFGVGASSLKVSAGYQDGRGGDGGVVQTPITITFGLDILDRNGLKRLEEDNPKVSLITWQEADKALRFATVIETDDAKGIWCGYYSNLIFLNA